MFLCSSFEYIHLYLAHVAVHLFVKSIVGVSVAVTSGSHLFNKDLALFKLLFPFSKAIL